MPDLSHLWQRFLLASSLVVGVLIGIAVTVFGYSNLGTVDVRWSIFHIDSVPLWTVPVVPLAIVLVAGTLYHWMDSLHHFTEHMRHRRRVHELEAEVATLRSHLDQVLEMPDQSTSKLPRKSITAEPEPEPVPEQEPAPEPKPAVVEAPAPALLSAPAGNSPEPENGEAPKPSHRRHPRPRRATLAVSASPADGHASAVSKPKATDTPNGGVETAATEPTP